MESYPLLNDFLVILAVSIPVSFLFHRLRFPSIVGFLVTGVIVGPYGAGLIGDTHAVRELAGIGVILLLFTIGLEFSIRQLLSSSLKFLFITLAQIAFTTALTVLVSSMFHIPIRVGVFLGFLFSLSSTAIVFKLLSDRAEIDTPHGRICVGILLFQDLLAIPLMLIVPSLSGGTINFIALSKQLIIALVAVAALFLAARYIVPLLLKQVIRTRNRDVFLVSMLFICLGTAYASSQMGLSLAIGAFIAGLVISESVYSHQVLSDFLPFRDTFNAIFFISVGMLLNLPQFVQLLLLNVGATAAILTGKILVLAGILMIAKFNFRVSWKASFSLSQVGEFSFLIADHGNKFHILQENLYQLFLASSILTIFFTPFLFLTAEPVARWLQSLSGKALPWRAEEIPEPSRKDHLVIIGFGLNGKNLSRVVRDIGIPFVVIELHDQLVREAQSLDIPVIFGDATSKEVLMKSGVNSARMAVIAISDAAATRRCVAVLRSMNSDLVIVVRTRYVAEMESLIQLGANIVIPEEFETSIEIFARVLEQYQVPDHLIDQQISIIRSDRYGMLRGLSLTQERLMKFSELFLKSTVAQIVVDSNSPAKNRSLRDLDLRARTGASIIAVIRSEQAITNPDANFELLEGDMMVLWGAHQQLAAAQKLLLK
jgi:CPA2 family monovalent cation:H+ antiporter-2